MPNINIKLTDNTGAGQGSNAQVVFIPGILKVKGKPGYTLDDNNCIYLDAHKVGVAELKEIFVVDTAEYQKPVTEAEAKVKELKARITELEALESPGAAQTKELNEKRTELVKAEAALATLKEKQSEVVEELKATSIFIQSCIAKNYNIIYCYSADATNSFAAPSLNFLNDKDNYNVKYLTLGVHHPIEVTGLEKDDTITATLTTTTAASMLSICNARTDCLALLSVKYDAADMVKKEIKGDELATAIKAALQENALENGQFGELLFPNTTAGSAIGFVEGSDKYSGTLPSTFAYLVALGDCLNNNQYWLPVANSARGGLAQVGDTDITVTKYNTDKNIIVDRTGVSFNTIVKLRPYGNVIWGDRTLLKLEDSVKASGYLSLMGMVCDISKEAYASAVRYTYDSNNTTTWFNFKTRIVNLLDQIVASGVLQSYTVNKLPSKEYNKLTCRIKVYPNLPVENFDIYIDLHNAEVTTSDNEAVNA